MHIEVITPPTQTPVSLDEAKQHLRVDHPDDDAEITRMIAAATQASEDILRRALCTQTLRYAFRTFPTGGSAIVLPRPPVRSVVGVNYIGENGLVAGMVNLPGNAVYELDPFEGTVVCTPGNTWPQTVTHRTGAYVDYIAGYGGPADVPQPIRQAILQAVGHYFANREDVITGTISTSLPQSSMSLLMPYRHLAIV